MSIHINLIPIGNSYWVTATKVGSIYLNNFSNSENEYLRLSFFEYNPEHELEKDMLVCKLPNGLSGKIIIEDFNHNVITNQYTQDDIINIFNKVSVIVIRNPKDRFISGMIHKLAEFFVEIKTFSIKLGSPGSGGMRGPNSGLIRHKVKMYTKYKAAIIRPGNTIP